MKAFQKPLSIAQEKHYLQKYQEGDSQAKNILIEHNLRLVAHVVKKYQGVDEETDDLISIGTIGLIKAINTFNPQKATRLSTYAARCIENELLCFCAPAENIPEKYLCMNRLERIKKAMRSICWI